MMQHEPYTHEHPGRVLALKTRTKLLGTLNVAVALRGRSCGWGTCEHPRRTFVGKHRIGRLNGLHFVELVLHEGMTTRTLFHLGQRRPNRANGGES